MNLDDLILIRTFDEFLALILYAGPDQVLPIVSILGAIIGVLLIWWRRLVLLVRKSWMRLFSKSSAATKK